MIRPFTQGSDDGGLGGRHASRGWFAIGLGRGPSRRAGSSSATSRVVFTIGLPVLLLLIFGSVFNETIDAPTSRSASTSRPGMIASGLLNTGFQTLAIGIRIERENGGAQAARRHSDATASYFAGKFLLVATIWSLQIVLLLGVGVRCSGSTGRRRYGWFTFAWLWLLGDRRAPCWASRSPASPRRRVRAGDRHTDRDRPAVHLGRLLPLLPAADRGCRSSPRCSRSSG